MEEFGSRFRQVRALRDKEPSLNPVEIALIDDGTDITHPDLKGMKISGKSFHHYYEGSTWRVSPYWDSTSGHGTLMARLIHRICPSAVIHVIKLQTFIGEGSTKLQINPDSAISVSLLQRILTTTGQPSNADNRRSSMRRNKASRSYLCRGQ